MHTPLELRLSLQMIQLYWTELDAPIDLSETAKDELIGIAFAVHFPLRERPMVLILRSLFVRLVDGFEELGRSPKISAKKGLIPGGTLWRSPVWEAGKAALPCGRPCLFSLRPSPKNPREPRDLRDGAGDATGIGSGHG